MAAVNSVQGGGLRLPIAGIASPRLLMCSASMGAEGSVTLQLREAVEAPDSSGQTDTKALTIGYSESDLIAGIHGSLHTTVTTDSIPVHSTNNNLNGVITVTATKITPNDSNSSGGTSPNGKENNKNIIDNDNDDDNQNRSQKLNINDITASIQNTPTVQNASSVKKSRTKTSSPTRHGPQQCQVCSKVFGNASALAKHKLTHSDERKYVCSMCSKAFKRQDHLNGHMLTHRNKKPYECKAEGCGKSYCDARSLRRHTENHHSSVAMAITTPNQVISSTGTLNGLSLSPATASGDASSPHGSNCIQFNGNGNSSREDSKSSSPSLPASNGTDGLSRQQIDLISQIMQQTRTNVNFSTTNIINGQKTTIQRPRTWNMQTQLQNQTQTKSETDSSGNSRTTSTTAAMGPVKPEQRPVECNLCHRKFKNIPALNGHMRLHGGYFKKDTETKKCDKKESSGPPLQTASVGIRALIEEKIISKRGKDLKSSFVIPAPPSRRLADAESFVMPKTTTSTNTIQKVTSAQHNAINQISMNITPNGTIEKNGIQSNKSNMNKPTTTSIETKDATLIELLKRGTKVAVTCNTSDSNGGALTFNSSTAQTTTVLLPSNVSATSSPVTPTTTPPLTISVAGNNVKNAPLALTISQNPNGCADIYTLAYSTDTSSTFFNENDIYNVPDTAMLLESVDSIQLLQNSSSSTSQLADLSSIGEYTLGGNNDLNNSTLLSQYTPSRQIQAVLNSPLPESLAEFSALHSKDYVLYETQNDSTETLTNRTINSSHSASPISYPTPPASHEGIAQTSPFFDETHHFGEANSYFDDKKNIDFLNENDLFKDQVIKDSKLNDCEQILKLKHELFDDSKVVMNDNSFYKLNDKNAFISKSNGNHNNNAQDNMDEFNHNLSFLDESQNFLVDTRNPSSPLSAAFFTSTMSSAEEVKEALQEVLPNDENITCEQSNGIDLYYLPSLGFQSQIMLNSDDPLLSSSPKDFSNKLQIHRFDFDEYTPMKKIKIESTETETEAETDESVEKSIINRETPIKPNENRCDKLTSESFLCPSSLPKSTTPIPQQNIGSILNVPNQMSSKEILQSLNKSRPTTIIRRNVIYKSNLRKHLAPYYTPSPILDPNRSAPGLYTDVCKPIADNENDMDFTENACVPEFVNKSKVNIGSDFQAVLSDMKSTLDYKTDELDQQLWNPNIIKNECQIRRFVNLAKSSAFSLGFHSEETALNILQETNGEIQKAILKMLQQTSPSIQNRWQLHEIEIFLNGLEEHGKNFNKIAKEITSKTTGECVQFYYFWKKLCIDYKSSHLNTENITMDNNNGNSITTNQQEVRPHVCEMPDCSASFTSKAALHGHTRIHCIGRNQNSSTTNPSSGQILSGTSIAIITKEDFPCKVCGKIFNKVKSRSAHMKSHRVQEPETSTN